MKNKEKSPIEILAEKAGKTKQAIYYLAKKLGRLPTEEEVMSVKNGRPRKYK